MRCWAKKRLGAGGIYIVREISKRIESRTRSNPTFLVGLDITESIYPSMVMLLGVVRQIKKGKRGGSRQFMNVSRITKR